MMMLKMMNPFGSVTDSIPGVGGDKEEDSGLTKEEMQEQERQRQEAIKEAERERRVKYKKQEEERENIRAGIREKYKIEKKEQSDDEDEEDEEDDGFGGSSKKAGEEDDPVLQAKALAEKQLADAKALAGDKCSIQ